MTENQEAVKAEETVQEEKAVAATQEAAAEQKEEAVNPNLRTLEVTIDGKEFQDGVTKELRRLSKKAKMPGFRPGHVPFAMVEAMYGQQASAEVINTLLEREANKAMRDGQYRVVGQFDAKPLAPAEGSKDLRFEVSFEVYPDIVLPDFSSVELKRYLCTVDDEAVNKTIDTIVKQRVTFTKEEGRQAAAEDRLTVNFTGTINGEEFQGGKAEGTGTINGEEFQGGKAEGFSFVLGQGRMLPEFEDAATGMAAGQKKTFSLTFPENYGPKELNGAQVEFEVELTKLEKANLPEVNDDFAKMLGVEGGVEAMRQEIRANLEREVKSRIDVKNRTEVFETLAKTLTFAVPAALIDNEAASLRDNLIRVLKARNPKGRQIEKSVPAVDAFRAEAENRVRLGLFVAELSAKEKLAATEEAVKEAAKTIASSYQEPDDVVSYLLNDQASRNQLFNQVQEENIARWVLEHAKTEDVAVDFDAVMAGQL